MSDLNVFLPNRSDGGDDPHSYLSFLDYLYKTARNEKRNRRNNWLRNYRLVNNRSNMQMNTQWQPAPRSSEVYPLLSDLVAWMTDQNIVIDITPAADPHSDFFKFNSKICNDLSSIMYSVWQSEACDLQVKLSDWDCFVYGTGILKAVWDNELADGYGNAVTRRVDPYSFYPDPYASCLADCEYLIEARMMTYGEIERRWPDAALELEAVGSGEDSSLDEAPKNPSGGGNIPVNPGGGSGSIGGDTYQSTFRWQMANEGSEFKPTSRYPVFEYWLRENEPYYVKDAKHVDSRWKVVVVSRGVILMEEWADDILPFNDHPYSDYRFDDIGEFWGISLVDHLADPQVYVNRLLAALQMNAEITGNPIFLDSANSGISRAAIPSRPGNRLIVNQNAMASNGAPYWLQPPSMSPDVLKLIQFWIARMENIAGVSAMVKGNTPPTARQAAQTQNTIQEAAFVRIRAAQRNYERCLESCARKIADLIIQNYTEPRIMSVAGPGAKRSAIALGARHFLVPTRKGAEPLKYSLLVQAGATAPTSRQARVAEADKLFAFGAIDDQAVLEAHQYPNADEVLARKVQKQAAGTHNPPGARQRAGRNQ